jgi:YHS domain-containing protein
MKKAALILAASLASVCAFAQAKPAMAVQPKPAVPVAIECPVMKGNKVIISKATKEGMYADHNGRRYFFCCAGCKPAFKKNPAKYKAAKSIPAPKKAA